MYEVTGVFRVNSEIRFPQPQSRSNTLVSRGTALWSKEMETLGSENRISRLHYCYKDPRGLLAGSPQERLVRRHHTERLPLIKLHPSRNLNLCFRDVAARAELSLHLFSQLASGLALTLKVYS